MANSVMPPIDYAHVLSDLRAKRDEIDTAIRAIERLYPTASTSAAYAAATAPVVARPSISSRKFAQMGVYEAACLVLESVGRPLTTPDLIQAIKDGGKEIDMKSATTLYRSVKEKGDDCKFKRVGEGKEGTWALKAWN